MTDISGSDTMGTPPGWYADNQGGMRWWDGSAWTDHVQPVAPSPGTPPMAPLQTPGAKKPWYRKKLWWAVAAVVIVIAAASASGGGDEPVDDKTSVASESDQSSSGDDSASVEPSSESAAPSESASESASDEPASRRSRSPARADRLAGERDRVRGVLPRLHGVLRGGPHRPALVRVRRRLSAQGRDLRRQVPRCELERRGRRVSEVLSRAQRVLEARPHRAAVVAVRRPVHREAGHLRGEQGRAVAGSVPRGTHCGHQVQGFVQRPSACADRTSARPSGRIRPSAESRSTLAMLRRDHFEPGRRRV